MGYFFPQNMQFIGIGIGSVLADMKKSLSVIYRIGRFKKWHLLVLIGIGRYEKKLIGRTLIVSLQLLQNCWSPQSRMNFSLQINQTL